MSSHAGPSLLQDHQQVAGLRGRMAQKRTRTMNPGKLQHVELPREV